MQVPRDTPLLREAELAHILCGGRELGQSGRSRGLGSGPRLGGRGMESERSDQRVTPPVCGGGGDVPPNSLAVTPPTTITKDTGPRRRAPPGRCTDHLSEYGPYSVRGRPAVIGLLRMGALGLTSGQTDRRPAGLHL